MYCTHKIVLLQNEKRSCILYPMQFCQTNSQRCIYIAERNSINALVKNYFKLEKTLRNQMMLLFPSVFGIVSIVYMLLESLNGIVSSWFLRGLWENILLKLGIINIWLFNLFKNLQIFLNLSTYKMLIFDGLKTRI